MRALWLCSSDPVLCNMIFQGSIQPEGIISDLAEPWTDSDCSQSWANWIRCYSRVVGLFLIDCREHCRVMLIQFREQKGSGEALSNITENHLSLEELHWTSGRGAGQFLGFSCRLSELVIWGGKSHWAKSSGHFHARTYHFFLSLFLLALSPQDWMAIHTSCCTLGSRPR